MSGNNGDLSIRRDGRGEAVCQPVSRLLCSHLYLVDKTRNETLHML